MVVQANMPMTEWWIFYFFRKEKEGMISESCRSLCTALDSRKHAQVCLREDMSWCVYMYALPLDMF